MKLSEKKPYKSASKAEAKEKSKPGPNLDLVEVDELERRETVKADMIKNALYEWYD